MSFPSSLPHLPPITRLSPRVIRILGANPSKFTLQGTNTYLLGTGRERLLLDSGEGKSEWKESLEKVLRDEGAVVREVLLSHWHGDHVGGVKDVGKGVRVWKNSPGTNGEAGWEGFEDGKVFEAEGVRLTAWHTPGHTVDHMCFFLHEEGALFSADNVLGHGTAVFEDLGAYMASLHRMRGIPGFGNESRIYPGHGEVVEDGKGKVEEYISHRQQREEEILGVLGREGGKGEWGSMEIVKVVYAKYPANLHGPAEGGVKQVLRKLEGDGRVQEVKGSGKWRLVDGGEKAAL